MDGQVPADVVQERYERLVALVEQTTFAENRKLTGATVEVLVAEGEGRKDAATHRMSGRARDNRLVHFTPDTAPHQPDETGVSPRPDAVKPGIHQVAPGAPRPGDVVTVMVTRAAPHYLLSDAAPLSLRRTRAGDAWEAAATAPATPPLAAPAPAPSSAATPRPAPAPAAPASAAPSPAPVLLGMPGRHP
jgi:tRNA-2-methylthio-N6-dimethylallyladenosine synthase